MSTKWIAPGIVAFAAIPAHAQLSGPPAGVPVPPVTTTAPDSSGSVAEAAPDIRVFRIRVLDGRNGLPLENAHVRLWYDDAGTSGFALTISPSGIALMPEPVGVPIRILIAADDRIDCRRLPQNEPAPGYNLQQIADKGITLSNHCGVVSAKAKPGELVFFARPLRWYENINRP